ncbi:hypothetical protein E2C01_031903 [Portunus trituberculatus]|uniref:Uncharacterized protein n=1 Tax=Portunus trituberculatus TaxID=210409 RepID=A0A5B7EZF7_PORTR|nr:hypothetical protein [Portunus trituberculatus]
MAPQGKVTRLIFCRSQWLVVRSDRHQWRPRDAAPRKCSSATEANPLNCPKSREVVIAGAKENSDGR